MLDAQTQTLLNSLSAKPLPRLWEMSPQEWRAATDELFAATGLPPADIADRTERIVPGPHGPIPVRVYRPRDVPVELLPGLVYFHGGGMLTSSIDTYDSLVQHLCAQSGCAVISVDYRLAPEHKFPVAFDDAYAAACWVHDNAATVGVDPARLAIGGDSAGGLLAATVAQTARDRGGPPIAFQLLVYPAVGTRGYSASMAEFATGYLFERDELDWAYAQYLNDPSEARDPRVCPIAARDFGALPPAYVLCAEYEIMRDDIEHYAALLADAGVPVELRRWPGQVHPFLNLAGVVDAGREAIAECASKLRQALTAVTETKTYDVAFENEYVRIVQVDLADGEVPPPYEPVAFPVVSVDLLTGEVACHDTAPPSGPGSARREVLVEVKGAPPAEELPMDAVALEPGRFRVEHEDDRVRVVRLSFAPGEQGSMVSHPPRVLVTVSDVHVRVEFEDDRTDERGAPAGIAGWLPHRDAPHPERGRPDLGGRPRRAQA